MTMASHQTFSSQIKHLSSQMQWIIIKAEILIEPMINKISKVLFLYTFIC